MFIIGPQSMWVGLTGAVASRNSVGIIIRECNVDIALPRVVNVKCMTGLVT